jgi:decaprenyl-phosphate phosphoribosyltransferase
VSAHLTIVQPGSAVAAWAESPARSRFVAHARIMRADHWVKNVFVFPGVAIALSMAPKLATRHALLNIVLGLLATCLVCSSNYVINEMLDAPFDRLHPTKSRRPAALGQIIPSIGYVQWITLMLIGVGIAMPISKALAVSLLALWVMGCVYNIRPMRSKDVPYVDVLSEAINNPLRMLAGWFIVNPPGMSPPASLLISYWMVGAYFMAIKRYAEYRQLDDAKLAAGYRKSFAFYTEQRLLVSIMFYASTAMLFLGAFVMRYRLELILAVPLVAWVMAVYLQLGFKADSAVQSPEKLHREPLLMASVCTCALLMGVLFFVRVPILYQIFAPTAPTSPSVAGSPPTGSEWVLRSTE